jgi:hypothetical protein
VFLIARAKSFAQDNTLIFGDLDRSGIVSVTINSVNGEF